MKPESKIAFQRPKIKVLLDILFVCLALMLLTQQFAFVLKTEEFNLRSPKRIHAIVLFFVCERISSIGQDLFIIEFT